MIYFDNAATGGFKPSSVYEIAINTMKYLNVNAGRSGHKLSIKAEEQIYKTRKMLQSFFNSEKVERVIFTKNCTEALNLAILGTVKLGGNVVTTCFEHNSVLRPLYNLVEQGKITLTIVKPQNNNNTITCDDIKNAIREDTYMVCVVGASNVTGQTNEIYEIGNYLRDKKIIYLVDGAQIAGHLQVDLKNNNINIFCFSGHKGMNSLQGVGCLIFDSKTTIYPTFFGGSGSESFERAPSGYPEMLECGTNNLPAINSLLEGCLYNKENIEFKQKTLYDYTCYLIKNLSKIEGIKLYSAPNPIGIVSFSYKDYSSQEVTTVLSNLFDIAVRGGYHCAPLTHEFLNTKQNGLIRVSLDLNNTKRELDKLIYAISNLENY